MNKQHFTETQIPEGALLGIPGGVVPPGSPNPDPISDQKMLFSRPFSDLGPVVPGPISANPGLNFNPGYFFFCSKVFSPVISSLLFIASNHQL